MVKFKNGPYDLTQIEIVLTDFGMADSDSKGGTPIFASPECFEKKEKKSDIFSFGRVILFLLLPKHQFTKWLFVPIKNRTNLISLRDLVLHNELPNRPKSYLLKMLSRVSKKLTGVHHTLYLVSQMTSLTSRISLQSARTLFDRLRRNSRIQLNPTLVSAIQSIISNEISNDIDDYTSELCDFR